MRTNNLPFIKVFIIAISSLFILFCNPSGKDNDQSNIGSEGISKELKPLYNEVMTIHDEAMPKLSDITKLQDQLKITLDSLRSRDSKEDLVQANRILGELNRAENAMWSWMHNFSKLDSIPQSGKAMFLEQEKASATDMSNLVNSSIEAANAYLSNVDL
jgi:hypothetical protein